MELSPESLRFVHTLTAAIIGSLVGASSAGFINYNSNRIQYRRNRRDSIEDGLRGELALLEVFESDLNSLTKLHSEASNLLVNLADGQPLDSYIPITLNYFSVFENNVGNLGRIRNRQLISQIIDTYQLGKALIDSLRLNNDMTNDYRRWFIEFETAKSETAKGHRDRVHSKMCVYAVTLKDISGRWTQEILNTQNLIHSYRLELARPAPGKV